MEVFREDENTWKDVWRKQMCEPNKIGEPAIKVFIIQDTVNLLSELMISCHHAWIDGRSLMQFAHEMLLTYENPNIEWEQKRWHRTMKQVCRSFPNRRTEAFYLLL